MSVDFNQQPDEADALIRLYDTALADVYGYLVSRCGSVSVAEELTSEVFMAAVRAVAAGTAPPLTIAWLIGVARHKLIDHWRHREVENRRLAVVNEPDFHDDWDVVLDVIRSHDVLGQLSATHRGVLTLRYLDGLAVADVAVSIDRSVHATEALLVRARNAFRHAYGEDGQ